jgi:hypothetical protein
MLVVFIVDAPENARNAASKILEFSGRRAQICP